MSLFQSGSSCDFLLVNALLTQEIESQASYEILKPKYNFCLSCLYFGNFLVLSHY